MEGQGTIGIVKGICLVSACSPVPGTKYFLKGPGGSFESILSYGRYRLTLLDLQVSLSSLHWATGLLDQLMFLSGRICLTILRAIALCRFLCGPAAAPLDYCSMTAIFYSLPAAAERYLLTSWQPQRYTRSATLIQVTSDIPSDITHSHA